MLFFSNSKNIGNYVYSTNPIGDGSFSTVYKGYGKDNEEPVAIKKINKTKVQDHERIDMEIEIMKKLDHPHIIKLYETIIDNKSNIYLIMEYCPGGNLAEFLSGKPLKEKYAKKFMIQMVSALQYLISKKIIHRDLKPQNILLFNQDTIKIIDFGFAKCFYNDDSYNNNDNNLDKNMIQTICGSPIYMAPEIIKCDNYTIKTDLWSVGIILYEMLVGCPPYKAKTHIELVRKIDTLPVIIPNSIKLSNNCSALIFRLLQKNSNKRISWDEFFHHDWFNSKSSQITNFQTDSLTNSTEISIKNIIVDNYDDILVENRNIKNRTTSPILIKKKEIIQTWGIADSPLFGIPISSTPNTNNGYILIENENVVQEQHEDTFSESLIEYMSNTINYFKNYYRHYGSRNKTKIKKGI